MVGGAHLNACLPLNSKNPRLIEIFPTSSGGCKHFLKSPGGVLLGEGGNSEPRTPVGDALPLVSVPTSASTGAAANGRCLVWHPDDEVLVPLAESPDGGQSAPVSSGGNGPIDCAVIMKSPFLGRCGRCCAFGTASLFLEQSEISVAGTDTSRCILWNYRCSWQSRVFGCLKVSP